MNLRSLLLATTASLSLASFAGCDGGGSGSGGSGGTTSTAGSGGTTNTGGSGGSGGTGGSTTTGFPAAPKLGAQIDRFGRPAINTALNHTFDVDAMKKDAAKDAWNANSDPATWSDYVTEIEHNLALLDGLDMVCGNQLLVDPNIAAPARYKLAPVLANDRLFVNTAGDKCTLYLAVEGNAVGIPNTDCGGRRLSYDVIETSYSVLAAGALNGIDDKVSISEAAKGETFPHLADPQ